MKFIKKFVGLTFVLSMLVVCFMSSTMVVQAKALQYNSCSYPGCPCRYTLDDGSGTCLLCRHPISTSSSSGSQGSIPQDTRPYVTNPFTGEKYYPRDGGNTFTHDFGRGDPIWDAGLYYEGFCKICTCPHYRAGDGWCSNCGHSCEAHTHAREQPQHTHSYGAPSWGGSH